jgi:hypothetical protein
MRSHPVLPLSPDASGLRPGEAGANGGRSLIAPPAALPLSLLRLRRRGRGLAQAKTLGCPSQGRPIVDRPKDGLRR